MQDKRYAGLAGGSNSGNDAVKVGGSGTMTASPPEKTSDFYQGQKVALGVDASKETWYTKGYKTVTFCLYTDDGLNVLDRSKLGLVVHPDTQTDPKVTMTSVGPQFAVQKDGDTYTASVVVLGRVSSSDYGFIRWNIQVEGVDGQGKPLPVITLDGTNFGASTDYGYGSNAVAMNTLQSSGNRVIQGVADNSFQLANAIYVSNAQVLQADATTPEPKTFSAFISALHGDLSKFTFWKSDKQTKYDKIQVDGVDTYVWIDSDANGVFSFYVTSNLAQGVYSDTLLMTVGNAQVPVARVIVSSKGLTSVDATLPAPYFDIAQGSEVHLSASDALLDISIPRAIMRGAFQTNDTLSLMVNNVLQSANVTYDVPSGGAWIAEGFPDCFQVSSNSLGPTSGGKGVVLSYAVLRDGQVGSQSTMIPFTIYSPSNGTGNIPPVSNPIYPRPTIIENKNWLDLDFDSVEKGLTFHIAWGAGWTPKVNDVINLFLWFDGWNRDDPETEVSPNPKFPVKVGATDLTNGYVEVSVDYGTFAGYIRGPRGERSTVYMNYQVPGASDYSEPTPVMNIDTDPD